MVDGHPSFKIRAGIRAKEGENRALMSGQEISAKSAKGVVQTLDKGGGKGELLMTPKA